MKGGCKENLFNLKEKVRCGWGKGILLPSVRRNQQNELPKPSELRGELKSGRIITQLTKK